MKNLKYTAKDFEQLLKAASAVADELGEVLEADMGSDYENDEENRNRVVVLDKLDAILNRYSDYLISQHRK